MKKQDIRHYLRLMYVGQFERGPRGVYGEKVSRLHRLLSVVPRKVSSKVEPHEAFVVHLCHLPKRAESEHASSGESSMKNKRIKSYRRAMQLYQSSFGFRSVSTSPHQTLCQMPSPGEALAGSSLNGAGN